MYQLFAANVSLGGREGRASTRDATERGRAPCVMHVSGGGRAGGRQSAFATGVGKTRPADRWSVNACAVSQ